MSGDKAHSLSWTPGDEVAGTPYRIIRPLGAGAMGQVYEAEHTLLGVRRALKVLSRRAENREALEARLRTEARALASLKHPNLVDVHDLGFSADGRLFFAMELLTGMTLRGLLERRARLETEEAVAIGIEILDGLSAAHEKGLIHRDVKPENVFIEESGGVKLLDFGIAKAVDAGPERLTAEGNALGTPWYMAPEQAQAREVDARADVYAVGVLLWEMLAGSSPFFGLDALQAAVAIVTNGVPLIDVPDLPEAVAVAVNRATAKGRDDRHPTAAAFAAELRRARGMSSGERVRLRFVLDDGSGARPSVTEALTHATPIVKRDRAADPQTAELGFATTEVPPPALAPARSSTPRASRTAGFVVLAVALGLGAMGFWLFGRRERSPATSVAVEAPAAATGGLPAAAAAPAKTPAITVVPTASGAEPGLAAPSNAPVAAPRPAPSPARPAPSTTAGSKAPSKLPASGL